MQIIVFIGIVFKAWVGLHGLTSVEAFYSFPFFLHCGSGREPRVQGWNVCPPSGLYQAPGTLPRPHKPPSAMPPFPKQHATQLCFKLSLSGFASFIGTLHFQASCGRSSSSSLASMETRQPGRGVTLPLPAHSLTHMEFPEPTFLEFMPPLMLHTRLHEQI